MKKNQYPPKVIVVAHYDCVVGAGATDNGASVQIVFNLLKNNSELLKDCLFLFGGSEEESYSSPEGFWGFKVFEAEYLEILKQATEIIVLDSAGVTESEFVNVHQDWVFWVNNYDLLQSKITWMRSEQSEVMKYYHSTLDTLDKINPLMVEKAEKALLERITKQL